METFVKTVLTLSLSVCISAFSASIIVFGSSEQITIRVFWACLMVTIILMWIIYLMSILNNKTASWLFFSQIKLLAFLIPLFLVLGLIIKPIYYSYHTYNRQKNIQVTNLVDRPFELVQGLPIGIEFEYSLEIKDYFLSSIHRALGGKKYYVSDYLPYSYYYKGYFNRLGPGGVFPEPLLITRFRDSAFKESEFQVGESYSIIWRSYPVFLSQHAFNSRICVIKSPHPLERVDESVYVPVRIGSYQTTTTNKYNLNEFYNNAIASGIPICS